MNPQNHQNLQAWLETGEFDQCPLDDESRREWELQSAIDTLLLMRNGRIGLSDEFQAKLETSVAHLQAQSADGTVSPDKVEQPADAAESSDGTALATSKKSAVLRWPVLAAITASGLLAIGWWFSGRQYPQPTVSGPVNIVGGGDIARDVTLTTEDKKAHLSLGGYCSVTLNPDSNVRIEGTDRAEKIVLTEGGVVCDVDRGQGTFTVSTDFGEVSVLGTTFEVQIWEEGNAKMNSKQMLVTVLTGTVIVATPSGQTTLKAGENRAFGRHSETETDGGYKLVWADEFDQDGPPNPKNWVFENGFVRNNEQQWYQEENAVCRNGHLVITGREDIKRNPNYVKGSTEPAETKFIEFTSSSLMTKGLHQWTMGRFVARAKIPYSEGMWPAFWMVGAKGQWPDCGEIDVMEFYQNKVLANVAHGTARPWTANWHSTKTSVMELGGKKWLDEFHLWRMDWDTESIRLYVDDRLLNETKLAETENAHTKWGPRKPFHHPHYMILNLALGGDNGGDMEKATLPAEYIIDYVRVYQRDEDKAFVAEKDDYVPPAPYTGKKVGIHHFSELPKTVNKKCSWDAGADSRCYSWKPNGSNRESAEMIPDYDDTLEGQVAYKFVLNSGWSRWLLEMDPKYGEGVADLSGFKKMEFGLKSKDAVGWESFRVFIESTNGRFWTGDMQSLGFKPDGEWHRCSIDLNEVKKSGVDLTRITTLFAIDWAGGVSNGEYFKLDDLYVE